MTDRKYWCGNVTTPTAQLHTNFFWTKFPLKKLAAPVRKGLKLTRQEGWRWFWYLPTVCHQFVKRLTCLQGWFLWMLWLVSSKLDKKRKGSVINPIRKVKWGPKNMSSNPTQTLALHYTVDIRLRFHDAIVVGIKYTKGNKVDEQNY